MFEQLFLFFMATIFGQILEPPDWIFLVFSDFLFLDGLLIISDKMV